MKVLLDTCVWGGVRKELENAGHDNNKTALIH